MGRCVLVIGAFLLAGLVTGCEGEVESGTGGGGTGGEAGSGATGGGGSGGGTPVDPVAACKELATTMHGQCAGDVEGECLFDVYVAYCESERADVLGAGLDCLLQNSGGGCEKFHDLDGAYGCVTAALSAFDTSEAEKVAEKFALKCSAAAAEDILWRSEPPLVIASSATLAALDACVEAAADCGETIDCYKSEFGEIWPTCP